MAVTIEGTTIKLQNEFIYRKLDISSGPATKEYNIRPEGKNREDIWYPMFTFWNTLPFEAAVTINNKTYEAGPLKHEMLWEREGSFVVKEVEKKTGKFGDVLKLVCARSNLDVPKVELVIEYEIADELPLLIKTVKVVNCSDVEMVINNVAVENIFLWKVELDVFSDYYWDIMKKDEYYQSHTRLEFPEDIAMPLKPNQSFESFKCYEAVTSSDRDEKSVILHRIYKKLAPWITKTYIKQIVNTCNSFEEIIEVADKAAECGIEAIGFLYSQLWVNMGDYVPRPDIFPNGEEDMKKMVEYYHKKGLIILPYCSPTIAWNENCSPWFKALYEDPISCVSKEHPEWQYLGPDGIRYTPEAYGNMCYQSPWGDYIKGKLLYLIDELGFDGLDIDGPYHGLPCLEETHKHGKNASVRFMNWLWEKEFYGEVLKRNKIITAPQEWQAYFLGVGQRPGGYREEDYCFMGGMSLITQTRSFLYESQYDIPACSAWSFCSLDIYHKYSIEASDEDTTTYEHAIASMFGYGYAGIIFGKKLYCGERTKELLRKWIEFYKKYRETMKGELIHLSKPNHFEPDAVLHVSLEADIPALLVVFNPTGEEKQVSYELPLKHAGFNGGSEVLIEDYNHIKLDSRGHGIVYLQLEPFEIKTLDIRKKE